MGGLSTAGNLRPPPVHPEGESPCTRSPASARCSSPPSFAAPTLAGASLADRHGGATVCARGCAFTTIQAAVNAASPGDTITVGPGRYAENLVIDRPLTLTGSHDGTVLYPAVSAPTCSGGLLCAGGSNI